jgi:hypothetical protein
MDVLTFAAVDHVSWTLDEVSCVIDYLDLHGEGVGWLYCPAACYSKERSKLSESVFWLEL